MKNKKIYQIGLICVLLITSLGMVACGNKAATPGTQNTQVKSTGENKTSGKLAETVSSKPAETTSSTTSAAGTGITGSTASSNVETKTEGGDELDCANMTADDLVKDIIDKESLTEEELRQMDSTFKYVEFDENLAIPFCISYEAFNLLNKKGVAYEYTQNIN